MKIRVLGCSGGIGGRHLRTTSFLVDHDILIDCGTGVAELSLDQLCSIDHVFLTHAHLDHVVALPLMIDSVGAMRKRPVIVHALAETIDTLRRHLFNWAVWPDFTVIPNINQPWLRFEPFEIHASVELSGRCFVPLPANHTVPAVAIQMSSGRASLVFTGDTGPCPELWQAINAIEDIKTLIIETAFPDRDEEIAKKSLHLSPKMLREALQHLISRPEIYITHLKPGAVELTMQEVEREIRDWKPKRLENQQAFEL
jgi:ribonuclease BN (tRNA processing enzyme)